ncbi:hypothetical protein LINPERPRIM_LOCUS6868 [Linum perenne]
MCIAKPTMRLTILRT